MGQNCEEDILCGINKPSTEDPEEMSALEKKHAVIIDAPESVEAGERFEVTLKVGEHKDHPNELAHFIEWMELYIGDTFLARLDLTPEKTHYVMKTSVQLDHAHPIRGRAKCNLHGIWEGEKELEVK